MRVGIIAFAGWWRVSAVAGIALSGCAAGDPSAPGVEALGQTSEAVIFGEDDRTEYRDSTASQKLLANSVGMLTKRADLSCNPSYCVLTQSTAATPLCADERFANQNTDASGHCTAFQIGPRTFATAGHCIAGDEVPMAPNGPYPSSPPQPRRCADVSLVFYWKVDDPNEVDANFNIDRNHVYQCTRVVEHGGYYTALLGGVPSGQSLSQDWAVFDVDRDVIEATGTGARKPLPFSREPRLPVGLPVTTIGHPIGLPVKIADGSTVLASPFGVHDFSYDGDTMNGSSGSPIIDEQSGLVRGVLSSGPIDEEDEDLGCLRNLRCASGTECSEPAQANTLSRVTRFFALDLDLNGKQDFVTLFVEDGLWKLRVDAFSTTIVPIAPQLAFDDLAMLALGDFDTDGIIDAAALINGALFSVHIAPGAIALEDFAPASSDFVSIQSADVDGNGVLDLVASKSDGTRLSFAGGAGGLDSTPQAVSLLRGPDFDGDGKEDVAIAATTRSTANGRINVIWGDSAKPGTIVENASGLYTQLVWGDFDDDGIDEMVSSSPLAPIDGEIRVGELNVIGWNGNELDVIQRLHRKDYLTSGRNDIWGGALAVGDFDADGVDDLAVGQGFREMGGLAPRVNEPKVMQIYGLPGIGLGEFALDFSESDLDLQAPDGREARAGWALAAGDYDCDGVDDLAIGAETAIVAGSESTGKVVVLYGQAGLGLSTTGATTIAEPGFGDDHVTGGLGYSLMSGNFNGDTRDGHPCVDLAIGSNSHWVSGVGTRGAVSVVTGGPTGISTSSRQFFQAGEGQLADTADNRYKLGSAMSVTRANGDGFDDLVVHSLGKGAGSMLIFTGSASGLATTPSIWKQGTSPIPDMPEQLNRFNSPYLGIGAGDFFGRGLGGTSNGLLVVGAPFEGFIETSPRTFREGKGWVAALQMGTGSAVEITDVREYGQDSAILGGRTDLAPLANFGWAVSKPRPSAQPAPAIAAFSLASFPASDFQDPPPGITLGEAGDPLGPWTSPQMAIAIDTTSSSAGDAALKLTTTGWITLSSARFGTASFDPVGDTLALDVFLPNSVTWGTTELRVTVPAAGIYDSSLATRELRLLPGGAWSTLSFPVSAALKQALLGDHANAQITVAVNTPLAGVGLDNLRFTGNLTARTVFHGAAMDTRTVATNPVLSFDSAGSWSSPQTQLYSDTELVTEGTGSLAVATNGWTELVSAPFSTSSLRPVSSTLSLDLYVPETQPNPSWLGDLQVYLTCPSTALADRLLGQVPLTNLFVGEFNMLQLALPSDVQSVLAGDHEGCTARVVLNVNQGSGVWQLDNMGFLQP